MQARPKCLVPSPGPLESCQAGGSPQSTEWQRGERRTGTAGFGLRGETSMRSRPVSCQLSCAFGSRLPHVRVCCAHRPLWAWMNLCTFVSPERLTNELCKGFRRFVCTVVTTATRIDCLRSRGAEVAIRLTREAPGLANSRIVWCSRSISHRPKGRAGRRNSDCQRARCDGRPRRWSPRVRHTRRPER